MTITAKTKQAPLLHLFGAVSSNIVFSNIMFSNIVFSNIVLSNIGITSVYGKYVTPVQPDEAKNSVSVEAQSGEPKNDVLAPVKTKPDEPKDDVMAPVITHSGEPKDDVISIDQGNKMDTSRTKHNDSIQQDTKKAVQNSERAHEKTTGTSNDDDHEKKTQKKQHSVPDESPNSAATASTPIVDTRVVKSQTDGAFTVQNRSPLFADDCPLVLSDFLPDPSGFFTDIERSGASTNSVDSMNVDDNQRIIIPINVSPDDHHHSSMLDSLSLFRTELSKGIANVINLDDPPKTAPATSQPPSFMMWANVPAMLANPEALSHAIDGCPDVVAGLRDIIANMNLAEPQQNNAQGQVVESLQARDGYVKECNTARVSRCFGLWWSSWGFDMSKLWTCLSCDL